MKQLTRKFVSVFFSVVFLLASGTGQLVHAYFHDHNYKIKADGNASALNTPHNYCSALQLTLPEFFESGTCVLKSVFILREILFVDRQPDIPHVISFKSSDRAPPFLV
jgi:hypothetical protein